MAGKTSNRLVRRSSRLMALHNNLKVTGCIIGQFPSTYMLPLVVLAVLLSLEVTGMGYFKRELVTARQVRVQAFADSIAEDIQLQVLVAVKPMVDLAALIMRVPQWKQLESMITPFSKDVVGTNTMGQYSTGLLVMPNAHIAAAFPVTIPEFVGVDILADNNRERNLQTIREGRVHYYPIQGYGAFAMIMPIFINGAAPNETFGYPKGPTNCSECYDPVNNRRFWGFLTAYVNIDTVIEPRRDVLSKLHKYSLLAPLDDNFAKVALSNASDNDTIRMMKLGNTSCMVLHSSPSQASPNTAFKSPVKVTEDYAWHLLVESSYKDINNLADGVLAALVVGTLILSCMLFSTLLSRRNLQLLLESLVPDAVIKQAREHPGFLASSKPILTAGSTADLMLQIASEVAAGRLPSVSDALTLRAAVLHRWDLYTPINLGAQLNQGPLDTDVAQALMQQLVGRVETEGKSMCKTRRVSSLFLEEGHLEVGWSSESFEDLQTALATLMSDQSSALSKITSVVNKDTTPPPDVTDKVKHVLLLDDSNHLKPEHVLLDSTERLLSAASTSWQLDAFELGEATNGFPLSTLGFFLLHQQGLINHFKLDSMKLARYLRRIEDGYHNSNPYHNNIHATDVLQTMHVILTKGGLRSEGYADELMMLASYMAAIVHDYDHEGCTNDFLINTQSDLAYKYNDRSPLENHHVAAAWALLKHSSLDFLPFMSPAHKSTLRKAVIDLVLATDMKQHFSILTHFTASTNGRVALLMEGKPTTASGGQSGQGPAAVLQSERLSVLQMALKCADLSHTAATLAVHKRWLACLEEEFFMQGDQEAALNLPISPLFDRSKPGASKSQVGFYNVVVLPMYSAFCTAFPDATPLLEGAQLNSQHWQRVQDSSAA